MASLSAMSQCTVPATRVAASSQTSPWARAASLPRLVDFPETLHML